MAFKKIIIVTLLIFFTGCFHKSNDDESSYTMTITATDTFSQLSNTYTQGEPITLNLTIANSGDLDVNFFIGDLCLASYEIFDSDMLSIGFVSRVCLTVVPIETPLKPGETLSETVRWNQDIMETQLPIGTYTIISKISGHEKNATITITLI